MRDVTTFVLAGGNGTRLYPLTQDQAKPALSFGGSACLLDVTLLNCYRSGISNVYLLVQYLAESIARRVRTGWDATEGRGELTVFVRPPPRRGERYRGTADAVWLNLDVVCKGSSDVLVLSGDHVYEMDYGRLIRFHRQCGADLTIASYPVPVHEAWRFGVLACGRDGRVAAFWEKPGRREDLPVREVPASPLAAAPGSYSRWVNASMGVYAFRSEALRKALAEWPGSNRGFDFGKDVIPAMIESERVFAYDFVDRYGLPAYWRDVGTVGAYHEAQMDMVGPDPRFQLRIPQSFPPSRLRGFCWDPDSQSVMASTSDVQGYVRASVVSPAAVIKAEAHVERSVVLEGAVVEAGAVVKEAVLGEYARVREGAAVGKGSGEACRRQSGRIYRTFQGVSVVPPREVVAVRRFAAGLADRGMRSPLEVGV